MRGAICRIDVLRDSKSMSRGTGTLVAPGIVLTALHLVADRHASPPRFFNGPITLTFPGHKTLGHVHGLGAADDWVLLVCESPPPAIPVPLGRLTQSHVEWETHGFPDSDPVNGELQAGTVEDYRGAVEGVAAFQLQGDEAVMGDGALAKGLSGAPVIVAGWMVGHLRNTEMADGQSMAGRMYACPAGTVAGRYPQLLTLGDVSHRRSVAPEPARPWIRWAVLVGVVLAVTGVVLLRTCAK